MRATPDLAERACGVLLHLTSLPGPFGSGDLGLEARRFVDFLAAAGQRWWQMLPVFPVGYGNSPYSALSTFAGNTALISLDALVDEGLLTRAELDARHAVAAPVSAIARVDYGASLALRQPLLRAAHARFAAGQGPRSLRATYDAFTVENRGWLEDYALFAALKRAHEGRSFVEWAPELRAREPVALEAARAHLCDEIERERFAQFLFAHQFASLRAYARERGVGLIGDLPIFVAHDSADTWSHPELFFVGEGGQPSVVAGVPPDYFSKTGQRWGNPLYRWDRHRDSGFAWWVARVGQTLARFDAIRLDHFIGFERYWEVPADEPTAMHGRWQPGPRDALFEAVRAAFGALPLIAEDLGLVTDEVRALRDRLGLPGIKLLQFAFGDDPQAHTFLPHNLPRHAVAYTGTHDNDTTVGWWRDTGGAASTRTPEQIARERRTTLEYLGGSDGDSRDPERDGDIHWRMIRALYASPANLAIVPMQDFLGLGSEARMNLPGTAIGNWEWRMAPDAATASLAARARALAATFGRAARASAPGLPGSAS